MEKGIGSIFNTFSKYFYIVIIFSLILFFPFKVLLARDYKTNQYIKSWNIKEGEEFSIIYTHSVQLTEVEEIYRIENNNIMLKETYFKSYGAGLPATTPYSFEITEKGFRIYNINEKMLNLIYRTGAEKADHRLLLNNREFRFLDFSEPRTGVKLDIKKIPFISYIVREGFR